MRGQSAGGGEVRGQSAGCVLGRILTEYDLVDTWRVQYPDKRGFTWVKAGPDRVCAAKLDRIYIVPCCIFRPLYGPVSPEYFLSM